MIARNPIQYLYDRMMNGFENCNPIIRNRLSAYPSSALNRNVRIDVGAFKTPQSDFKTNEIVLNQSYLSFLWCIIYIITDVAGDKAPKAYKANDKITTIEGDNLEIQQLDQLIEWALLLKTTDNTEWPLGTPDPTMETHKVRLTNVIFIDTINYIMYHEVAHLVNGHWNIYKLIAEKKRKCIPLDQTEYDTLIELELEADNFAYDCLISIDDSEEAVYHKSLSIVLAGLSNLFCFSGEINLTQRSHPNLHVRLYNVRQRNQLDIGYEFWLDNVMNVGISIFCKQNNIPYLDGDFHIGTDLMEYLFNLLDVVAKNENQ